MTFKQPQGFIAKIKHIFGYLLAILMIVQCLPGGVTKTDRIKFKISQDLTTESTEIHVEMTNKSLFSVEYEVGIAKLEKKIDDEWVSIELDHFINFFPASYKTYPEGCILPFETYESTCTFSALCNQDTLSAGDYRITFRCHLWNTYHDASCFPCEFTVAQA